MQQTVMTKGVLHYCPVCEHSEQLKKLCTVTGYDIFACGVCGADHVFPVPGEHLLKAYYDRPEWFEGNELGGYQDYDAQTEWSIGLVESVLEAFGNQQGLSVLDVGCGYGIHLALAAQRGWKCFGVELSDHARAVARERLGSAAYIVEEVSGLIPHEFDLVLILDTIEHLPSPYVLLNQLFSIGAITPKTQVVITTPNAGSNVARSDPAGWVYRHPPSHLLYYSAESLQILLRRLHFRDISVTGLHGASGENDLAEFAGLFVKAAGSDFTEFMRERYVPGTWSRIAEYEHLPRYVFARNMSENKRLLDFGCGTGYGSAILAERAANVIGLDIDATAIDWARESHRSPRLKFLLCDDLGASLPPASIDLVTCFEMIEHVDYQTQQAAIASIARLLHEDGLLVISTPNPAVTKLYGENPYHLREMTEVEFLELLLVEFPCVRIFRQLVRNSIAFVANGDHATFEIASEHQNERQRAGEPLAYIAVCSRQTIPEMSNLALFDDDFDLVGDYISTENTLTQARLSSYNNQERVSQLELAAVELDGRVTSLNGVVIAKDHAIAIQAKEIHRLNDVVMQKDVALNSQADEIHRLNAVIVAKDGAIEQHMVAIAKLSEKESELEILKQSKWYKFGNWLRITASKQ